MSSKPAGPIRQAWYRWKSLKLPWRKRFLVGLDLQGNTFWEFRDTLNSHKNRMRRIVEYPPATHYSEVKISPQWHQWLRHTRKDPPSLTEQSGDLIRQQRLKVLAAEADARWAANPSFLDAPGRAQGQPLPSMEIKDPGGYTKSEMQTELEEKRGVRNAVGGGLEDNVQNTETTFGEKVANDDISVPGSEETQSDEAESETKTRRPVTKLKEKKEQFDPWKQARGSPSEDWQPSAWDGGVKPRRRD